MSENIDIENLKYPIVKFNYSEPIDRLTIDAWINQIVNLTSKLKTAFEGLLVGLLKIIENTPTIKPYNETFWAETKDYKLYDSLNFIEELHKKFVVLLKSLTNDQLERKFFHPESKEYVPLKKNIGIYAWHGNHHVIHITALRKRMG